VFAQESIRSWVFSYKLKGRGTEPTCVKVIAQEHKWDAWCECLQIDILRMVLPESVTKAVRDYKAARPTGLPGCNAHMPGNELTHLTSGSRRGHIEPMTRSRPLA